MQVSIVIPVFNEAGNIGQLSEELAAALSTIGSAEAILVDDGSRDGTWSEIEKASVRWPGIRGIRCQQNGGQTSAMLIGLRAAKGEILVTMDGDLQNKPADIPKLLALLDKADVVCGYRARRCDTWSRRVASRIGNGIRNAVTRDGLRDTGCSLKAFHRRCLSDLPSIHGAHRFMGAYFRLHGRSIEQVAVDHRPRTHGSSKYTNLKRLPRTAFDLVGFLWYRSRLLKPVPTTSTQES